MYMQVITFFDTPYEIYDNRDLTYQFTFQVYIIRLHCGSQYINTSFHNTESLVQFMILKHVQNTCTNGRFLDFDHINDWNCTMQCWIYLFKLYADFEKTYWVY